MQASISRAPVSRLRRLRERGKQAPAQEGRPPPDARDAEAIEEPFRAAREEPLETDVAPDLLDQEPVTGDDLH